MKDVRHSLNRTEGKFALVQLYFEPCNSDEQHDLMLTQYVEFRFAEIDDLLEKGKRIQTESIEGSTDTLQASIDETTVSRNDK